MVSALELFWHRRAVRDTTGLVHYPIASSQLPGSRLIMTTYSVRDHFTRTLKTPTLALAQWQAQP
jgi:hypothetical protein